MDPRPEISGELGSRFGPGSLLTTLVLILGVAGGLCWFGTALLRRAAFTGLGTAGALDYSLTNTLLGGSTILAGVGTAGGALWASRSRLGLAGFTFGWVAVVGCVLLAGGSLGEFVLFRDDRNLGSAAWGWFVVGLGVTAVGLTGLGVRLADVWRGRGRYVAWWLAASVPLMVAGFGLGLLGTSMAVATTPLCAVFLQSRSPESEIRRAA
jgi:hypothetical protein